MTPSSRPPVQPSLEPVDPGSHGEHTETREQLRLGWLTGMPAGAAVIPVGLAFGVLVVQYGLPWWAAPLLSGVVFAGSIEFLLAGMLAVGAPLTQIGLTTLIVNFRHAFYALSFPLHRVRSVPGKIYGTFALTDEAFALASGPRAQRWSGTRILTLAATFQLFWVASSTAGALLGSLIPPWIKGLDFAMTALFVVLAIDACKARRSLLPPVTAVAIGLISAALFGPSMLAPAMGAYVLVLLIGCAVDRLRGRYLPTTGEIEIVASDIAPDSGQERSCG